MMKKKKLYEIDFKFYVKATSEESARTKALLLLCKDMEYIQNVTVREIKK